MFDLFDLHPNGTEGTRWMRIVSGLTGLLVGGGIGYLYGTEIATGGWLGSTVIGGLLGGFFGALFSFYVILGLAVILAIVGVIAWQVYFGG